VDSVFLSAAEDRRLGAAEIETRLVEELLRERASWSLGALHRGADRLLTGQPTMANLRNLARRLQHADLAATEAWLRDRREVLSRLPERLAEAARPRFGDVGRVVTISRSSAVVAVIDGIRSHGWRGETVVLDGSPAGGGADQAERLARTVDRVWSQPDATALFWLAGDGVTVLVGADAVSPQRFINACGTAALVELAAARSVPVVLVADTGKDLSDAELDELLAAGPTAREQGPDRRWAVFEAVPRRFVTVRLSERNDASM
jgi:translation initiation factor 2B subunit (eIF-2B alpha/beta/delta family)